MEHMLVVKTNMRKIKSDTQTGAREAVQTDWQQTGPARGGHKAKFIRKYILSLLKQRIL